MKFKKIQFKNADAQKIYENYLKQIYSATKKLSNEDQNDILMELNSHIFESISKTENPASEISNLLNVLDKIGVPNDVLKPLVAEKKLNQAIRTFNPIQCFSGNYIEYFQWNYLLCFFYFIFILVFIYCVNIRENNLPR